MTSPTIPCPKCNNAMTLCYYAERHSNAGWYCAFCGHYEKAIGREKLIKPEVKQ